jgi:tRNA(fMet)-specific endonuclease VapC
MLDTNIASEMIRNPAGRAAQRAWAAAESVCSSIIVAAELRCGLFLQGVAEAPAQGRGVPVGGAGAAFRCPG